MRVCYLSHADNYHTKKWANYFVSKGHEVYVLSLEKVDSIQGYDNRIHLCWLSNRGSTVGSDLQKIAYLSAIPECRRTLKLLNPDIVHAHYATSYGIICAHSCTFPYFLSVWGSDVYDFPNKSIIHKVALRHSLSRCSYLLSTSKAMAMEIAKYSNKYIYITPFGVDMELFKPVKRTPGRKLVIGTIKGLENKYGIDTLIKACALIQEKNPSFEFELRIAGKGSQELKLKRLAIDCGLKDKVTWLGFISQLQVAREWSRFDIAVVSSLSESFGVSAVEAQACGTPLIISDIPGLREACDDGKCALVVPARNPQLLARAIGRLGCNELLRCEMARKARYYVKSHYEVNECFSIVEKLYRASLSK